MNDKVVVSGIGCLSPVGVGITEHETAIEKGRSGLPQQDDGTFFSHIGSVPSFKPKAFIKNKKAIKFLSRQSVLGCSAAQMAIDDARLRTEDIAINNEMNALVVGAAVSQGLEPISEAITSSVHSDGIIDYHHLGNSGFRLLPPLWFLGKLPNTTAGQIAIQNSMKGLNYTIVNGANSGIIAIGEAFSAINEKRAVRAICGGTEDQIFADFLCRLLEARLATYDVSDARPFGTQSKGFICSEGSAMFCIEKKEEAQKRGVGIYASILGYINNYIPRFREITEPFELSPYFERCMQKCLQTAGVHSRQIDFIQAGAFGIPKLDHAEAIAISNIFGKKPLITSAHSLVGYSLAASGPLSTAFACLQLRNNIVSPIVNSQASFLENELSYVKKYPLKNTNNICLVNSFDYFGATTSLVLRKGAAS